MAGEQTTQLDPQSAALAKAEAARKTNLADDGGAVVPKGDELTPSAGGRDFANDRKAIFAHASRQRGQQIADDATGNGELQDYGQAMSDEMAVRLEAEARGENPDKAHREFVANGHRRPGEQAAAPAPAPAPAGQAQPPVASGSGFATVTINGRQLSVAQRDIDAAGGVNQYLHARELDEREGQLAAQVAEMNRRQAALDAADADLKRRQEDATRQPAVTQGASAVVPVSTSGQGSGPAASAQDINAEAERLVGLMFSGDPADATKAMASIIAAANANRQSLSAEQIAELAAQKLRETQPQNVTQPTAAGGQPKPVVDPRWETQRLAINKMAKTEYPEITGDPQAALRVKTRIEAMGNDPANRDRRAIDVAREALEIERQEQLRQRRVEVKQTLPPAPAAGGAQQEAQQDKIATGSDFVALLQQKRFFGRTNPSR